MIHPDTNVAIALLNNRQPRIRIRFEAARATIALGLSITAYHELLVGAANSARNTAFEGRSVPQDPADEPASRGGRPA